MRKDKRGRLERAGWKVGTVREFLGLSATEETLVKPQRTPSRGSRDRRSLAAFRARAKEPNLDFETVLKDLRRRGKL